jgi:hypothetical protein
MRWAVSAVEIGIPLRGKSSKGQNRGLKSPIFACISRITSQARACAS